MRSRRRMFHRLSSATRYCTPNFAKRNRVKGASPVGNRSPERNPANIVESIATNAENRDKRFYRPKVRHRCSGGNQAGHAAGRPHPNLRRCDKGRARHSIPLRKGSGTTMAGGHRFCFLGLGGYRSDRHFSRIRQISRWTGSSRPGCARCGFRCAVWLVRCEFVLASAEKS